MEMEMEMEMEMGRRMIFDSRNAGVEVDDDVDGCD